MPLKLSLKPKEAVVVNGAVLRNGDRRGTILLQNQARVLRQKDVLQAEATESPVQHLYFAVMQMYLTGQTEGQLYDQTETAIAAVMDEARDAVRRNLLVQNSTACAAAETYKALTLCRKLLKAAEAGNG